MLNTLKLNTLPKGLKLAKTRAELDEIEKFREEIFSKDYPALDNYHSDPHDCYSIIMYTENDKGKITSTARLIFDNPIGFPADSYASNILNQYRRDGKIMIEASRLAISDQAKKGTIALYYGAFYAISVENDIDSVIVVISKNHLKFYMKRLDAKLLVDHLENMNGSGTEFACAEWELCKTSDQFLKWVGLEIKQPKKSPYSKSTWNGYSGSFASIYTHYQREVYQESIPHLKGSVVDLGCGPARIAPLLVDNKSVNRYTGVESSEEMYKLAEFTMNMLNNPSYKVEQQKVEEVNGMYYSALSLLSYYAFPEPVKALRHIFNILLPGGHFVLANPNEKIDQMKIQRNVEKEMMWHTDYEQFKQYNLELASNSQAEFVPMDKLLSQLQSVGFLIVECHQKLYEGGLNFIVSQKPSEMKQ